MHVDLRCQGLWASANALADLSEDKAQFGACLACCKNVCVALQVALFNSATGVVYQTYNDFLVSFFFPLAFVGFARPWAGRWLAGLAVVKNLSPAFFSQRQNGGSGLFPSGGRSGAGGLDVDRTAAFVDGEKPQRAMG